MEFLLGLAIGIAIGWMLRANHKQPSSEAKAPIIIPSSAPVILGADASSAQATPPETPSNSWFKKDVQDFDSASVLLYFGAFLMIAGVGLFVGLSGYSGTVKTIAVLATALTFYAAGLALHQYVKRLRPVAITLTAMGLICLPLVGVAFYFYLTQTFGAATWFVTSAVSLLLYVVALLRIRQSLIGYMSVFMCLSLWLSVVAVIDAPVYFFGWAMIALGMGYLLAAKYLRLGHEVETPLSVSASVMVPAALVITLFFGTISPLQQGITALIAACFYALATWLEPKGKRRTIYFTLLYSLVPIGVLRITSDTTLSTEATAYVLTAVTALQLSLVAFKKIEAAWRKVALVISALAMGAAALLCIFNWLWLAPLLGIHVIIHAIVALYARSRLHMMLGLIALLVTPAIAFAAIDPPRPSVALLSAIYLAIGVTLLPIGRRVKSFGYTRLTTIAYIVAWSIAFLIGTAASGGLPMAISITVGLAVTASAYYERQPTALLIAAFLGGVAVVQGLLWQQIYLPLGVCVGLGSLGLAYYAMGKLQPRLPAPTAYQDVWVASGLAALYCGPLFCLLQGEVLWPSAIFLGIAGALTSYESKLRNSPFGFYTGGAIMLTAIQLTLYKLGLNEWQLYWYLWAMYATLLAYRLRNAAWLYVSIFLAGCGALVGLRAHHNDSTPMIAVAFMAIAAIYYTVGKIQSVYGGQQYKEIGAAWSYAGLGALYVAALLPLVPEYTATNDPALHALALLAAGAITMYETYLTRNRAGMYLGAAVSLAGLQWLLYSQQIHNVQIYTHLWALYFAALAWLAHRDKRLDERKMFTIVALGTQTIPLALEALGGNTNLGFLLLLESMGILLLGLWLRYRLVSSWGLAVAVGAVLYQLREFEFFVLLLLGAGIIGLGIYLLLKQDKKMH
jgi:hypothetical protein